MILKGFFNSLFLTDSTYFLISLWKHIYTVSTRAETFGNPVKKFTRSSRREVFSKKGALRNFAKFTGKHLCQRLFLIKLQAKTCSFIKKESLAQVFSCEFCEISKNTFSYRTPPVAASDSRRGEISHCIEIQLRVAYLTPLQRFNKVWSIAKVRSVAINLFFK